MANYYEQREPYQIARDETVKLMELVDTLKGIIPAEQHEKLSRTVGKISSALEKMLFVTGVVD